MLSFSKSIRRSLLSVPKYGFSSIEPPEIKGNYYELLGVEKEADKDEIRKAYKDLGKIRISNVMSIMRTMNDK